jgi:hypothetical protein
MLNKDYNRKDLVVKKKIAGRESQGTLRQYQLISGKSPVVKQLCDCDCGGAVQSACWLLPWASLDSTERSTFSRTVNNDLPDYTASRYEKQRYS